MTKDEEYLIWLAGFIDADGSFTITIRERKRKDGSINLTFMPVMNVRQNASTGRVLVEEIHNRLSAGKVYENARKDGTEQVWWQTTKTSEIISVGSRVYKYLRLKGPQAERAIRCAYLILEWTDGYNHDLGRLGELYALYESINPDSNWADRKKKYTEEELAKIASGNLKRSIVKAKIAADGLSYLPGDALRRVIGE